jgi:hypothetical protein
MQALEHFIRSDICTPQSRFRSTPSGKSAAGNASLQVESRPGQWRLSAQLVAQPAAAMQDLG